jgi:hypothetical protein
MGVCVRSEARRRADRSEVAFQVRGNAFLICSDAFLICGDAFLTLFAFLALFACLALFGCPHLFRCLDLCGRLDWCGCRAAHNNYCQQSHSDGFPHWSSYSLLFWVPCDCGRNAAASDGGAAAITALAGCHRSMVYRSNYYAVDMRPRLRRLRATASCHESYVMYLTQFRYVRALTLYLLPWSQA